MICDPLSAIALAGSAVAAGVNYMGQQDVVRAQNQSNEDWAATQRAAAAKASAADEVQRQKAAGALSTAETALSPENQTAVQQTAATDLNAQMLAGSPAASDNIKLLGGEPASTSVSSDMASRVTNAAREAQGRIKALAGITSYGGGYQGMGGSATQALADSAEDIGLASNLRGGTTRTLGVTQAIEPVKYAQGSDIAGTVASSLGNIAGSAFSSSAAGKGLSTSLKSAFGR